MQAVYRNQLGNGSLSAQQQLAMLQQQQYLQQLAAAGHLNGFPGGPGYVFNPGAAQESYLALNLAGQNGVPVLPVPYYAGVPWYPPAPGLVQRAPQMPNLVPKVRDLVSSVRGVKVGRRGARGTESTLCLVAPQRLHGVPR